MNVVFRRDEVIIAAEFTVRCISQGTEVPIEIDSTYRAACAPAFFAFSLTGVSPGSSLATEEKVPGWILTASIVTRIVPRSFRDSALGTE